MSKIDITAIVLTFNEEIRLWKYKKEIR